MFQGNVIPKTTSVSCVTSLLSSAAVCESAKAKLLQDEQSTFSSRNAESKSNAVTKVSLECSPLGLEDPVPQSDMLRLYVAHLIVSTVLSRIEEKQA